MARSEMARRDLPQGRLLGGAAVERMRAAGMKTAAFGQVDRAGYVVHEDDAFARRAGLGYRHGREQRLGQAAERHRHGDRPRADRRMPAIERARNQLQSILVKVVAAIEDRALVRAEVRSVRIKGLSSIERKAAAKGWKADEALSACSDLIGGRVVCNNIEDANRFAELLKERLPGAPGEFEIQDHTKNPIKGGYRALHVNFRLDIGGHPFAPDRVPCEVQIRSRLQDAWAELSHDDIYEQPELPDELRARAKDLAEILAAADRIASDIRGRVTEERIPPEQRPNLRRVSPAWLAFLFKETFGRSPPDYVIRRALIGLDSLEGLPAILGREEFRREVADAHQTIMPASISAEDTFLAALDALGRGEARAISKVRRDARREWREIDQFARREMLVDLPANINELMEQLESPDGGAWLIYGLCGKTLPAIDFAHVDLAGSKQRPEQHGSRVRRRQHRLRLDLALELLV
jgi:ppGpp synthetase/RelA/SpoT-type nucleotidyltranferase